MSLQEAEGMHRGKATWAHTAVSGTHSLTRTLTHPCTQAPISLRLFVQWFHKGGWWLGHVTQDPALSLWLWLLWLFKDHCVLQGPQRQHATPLPLMGVQVTCPTWPEHRRLQGSPQDIPCPPPLPLCPHRSCSPMETLHRLPCIHSQAGSPS